MNICMFHLQVSGRSGGEVPDPAQVEPLRNAGDAHGRPAGRDQQQLP